MNTWHACKAGNDTQGLVIDDNTGANIAVTYKAEHAPIVAAAPELLELVEQYQRVAEGLINRPTLSQSEFETLKSALRFTEPQRLALIASIEGV
jgi:hypothetical protein